MKPEIYRAVLRRFLAVSRQPGYLQKPEYKLEEYTERNQEIFLSSCYYKYNWSYNRFKVFLNAMLSGKGYFVCGLPYQIAIKEGLTSKEQLLDEIAEEDFDKELFEMEMECIFHGESQNAYFKYDDISKCRTLQKPIVPPTDEQYVQNKGDFKKMPFYRPKMKGIEKRLLCVDNSFLSGKDNDATVMHLLCGIQNGDTFNKSLEYTETVEGGNTEKQAARIKQLFYDTDCDYCVMDTQGASIGVFDSLTKITIDEERNKTYPAWIAMNDERKGIIRAIDKDAVPIVYSVVTSGFNALAMLHEMYVYTKNQIEKRKLKFLIGELEAKEFLVENFDFLMKDSVTQAKMILPYLQATRTITEMTQLETEVKNGYITLTEQSGKRKDRAMSLFYGMYYFKVLESEIKAHSKMEDFTDMFKNLTGRRNSSPFGDGKNPFGNNRNSIFKRK